MDIKKIIKEEIKKIIKEGEEDFMDLAREYAFTTSDKLLKDVEALKLPKDTLDKIKKVFDYIEYPDYRIYLLEAVLDIYKMKK